MHRFFPAKPARLSLLSGLLSSLIAGAAVGQASLPPAIARNGVSLGLESPQAVISGTVWLPMHDQAALDQAVAGMYAKGSPAYHQWMSTADLERFGPTAAELAAVEAELAAHHLTVVASDEAHFWVKFRGPEQDFESAFHTQLGRYQVGSTTIRAALQQPTLSGAASGLVAAVTGIDGTVMRPFHSVPRNPKTGGQLGVASITAATGTGPGSAQCIFPEATVSLSSARTSATYSGAGYSASLNSAGSSAGCGYSPQIVQQMYGMPNLYARGLTGKGQTIVLIEAYSSPTLTADLSDFSTAYGLTKPTASSLRVYQPAPVTGSNEAWAEETTLDAEWAHAIAPDAKIAVVAAVGQLDSELQTALLYAVTNRLGNVISCSFGGPESLVPSATLNTWNQIIEMAAAQGIAVQIASGDSGDYSQAIGYADVSEPADSPYATAVGGTSMAYLGGTTTLAQTGWGTNITTLEFGGTLLDPTRNSAFYYGSGGGSSRFFPKPAYQSALGGNRRLLPDVSALADPNTGVEELFTLRGQQQFFIIGGTSLASPLFSAMYALVEQATGEKLGQAAPYLAEGSPYLLDVVAPDTAYNPVGALTMKKQTTTYSTYDLSQPERGIGGFAALLWNAGDDSLFNITFGTDTSLAVTAGWDNVTGYGTPNFAQ